MKKLKTIGISVLMAACAVCLSLAFVACSGGERNANYGAGEEGFYYYDGANSARYMLSLQSGTYMITAGGETQYSGSYSYDEESGAISFDGGNFSAMMGDNALSLDVSDSGYSFKAYKYFDVTYVDENGVNIATESVLNGQSAKAITVEKDGYWFVGWYEDAGNSSEFAFDTSIAGDTTVYGWYIEKNLTATEYEITLDYGDGTTETISTMNGAVWTLPADGILGWWVSATNKSGELTYKYNTGDMFTADTTLYAFYSGMGASVTSNGVTWENVTGADVSVTVYKEDGTIAIARSSTSSSNSSYAPTGFTSLSAGTYTVEVTSGSTTEYLTYVVNGLSRVSKSSMDVIVNGDGRVISFAPVEGATGYEITISDGTKTVTEDLGSRTYYNFSGWDMTKEGLTFTVTAYADGYVSSVSDAYFYILVLDDVKVDIVDDVVTWYRVDGALEYEVIIYGEDGTTVLDSFYTTDTSYSLKYYGVGTYTISVQPKTDGYYSEARKYEGYDKSTLAAPMITDVTNYSVSWSGVTGAVSYEVMVGGATYTVTNTETLVFSEIPTGLGTYEISVKAIDQNGNDSPYSDVITATEGEFSSAVRYEKNTVYWDYDIEAAYYVVSVNGTNTTVSGGNSWEITLNKAGNNEIVVTAYDASGKSLGQASMTVYAYSITLDPNGATFDNGTATSSTIYVAQGDTLNLGGVEKDHANFIGWYTQADYTDGQSDSYEGKGSEVADGSVFTGSRDMYLYAYWSYEYVNVTLVIGTGMIDGSSENVGVSLKYNGTGFTLPMPSASSATDDFVGWYTGVDGNGTAYTTETGESNGTEYKGEETLYAYYLTIFSYQKTKYAGETVYSVSVRSNINISRFTSIRVPECYTVDGKDYDLIINSDAFANCPEVVTINIPDTVKYVSVVNDGYRKGTGAFAGCANIQDVNVYATGGEADPTKEPTYFSEDGVLFHKLSASGGVELVYYPYGRALTSYSVPATVSNEFECEADGVTPVTHDVVSIPTMVFRDRKITEITVPSTVTTVEGQAFYRNTYLTKVTFEAGNGNELKIENGAFVDCIALAEVTLPARFAGMEAGIFEGCLSLKNVYVEAGGENYSSNSGVLLDADGNTLVYYPIGRSGEVVTSQITTTNITAIGENAFAGNTKITSIVISENVTTISESAFEDCKGVTSLVFSGNDQSGDLSIGERAFYGCYLITEVRLPSNLVTLGKDAFANCTSLSYVYYDARDNDGADTLDFASGAFGADNYITTLEFGAHVPVIDFVDIFEGGRLLEIKIDSANANYYSDASGVVYDAQRSTVIYYPLTASGDYVLDGNVQSIGANVFAGRVGLTSITIGASVNTIAQDAFLGCTNLKKIIVDSGNENYASDENGILYGKENGAITELIYCPLASGVTSLEVAESVTKVSANAFYENGTIESVKFTASTPFEFETAQYATNDLRASTFYGCVSLTSVVLPGCMTVIPAYSFYDCEKLTGLTIPDAVTSIGTYAFYHCFSLVGDLNDGADGTALPDGLVTIGDHAFDMYVSSSADAFAVTIPASVGSMGAYAFYGCWNDSSVSTGIVFASAGEGGTSVSLTIGNYAFAYAQYATSLTVPARTTSMGTYAFEYFGYKLSSGSETKIEFESGCSITTVGDYAFAYAKYVKEITIPASVTSIGEKAFNSCTNLAAVNFAPTGETSGLTSIGANAFSSTAITGALEIPATVTSIGTSAFTSLGITSVSFGTGSVLDSIGQSAFSGTKITELQVPASVTTVGNTAFSSCMSLTKVSFQEEGETSGITELGNGCFNECTALTDVNLPAALAFSETSVTRGGSTGLFGGCTSLVEISIPSTLQIMRKQMFNGCTALTTVTFETDENGQCSLEEIGDNAFNNCTSLTSFVFPESKVSSISFGAEVFSGCTMSVTLSKSVTDVSGAFVGCYITSIAVVEGHPVFKAGSESEILYSLDEKEIAFVCGTITSTEITIPEGIETIGGSAFNSQTNVTKVIMGKDVKSIGAYAFFGCSSLETVVFPEGSAMEGGTVGEYAFAECYKLASINLPEGVTEVPECCFYGASLGSTTLPTSITVVGVEAFESTGLVSVNLPNVVSVGNYGFGYMKSLKTVTFGEELETLGNYVFISDSALKSITWPCKIQSVGNGTFQACSSLSRVEIPSEVTSIGEYVFYQCCSLTEVVLSDSLETIGAYAFDEATALASIDLPAGLTTLNQGAFYKCYALTEIVIPEKVTSLGSSALCYCTSLTSVVFGDAITTINGSAFESCTSLTSIVIPRSVTSLGTAVFRYCTSLEYVYTGELVTSIGNNTFYGCTALETVEFGSSLKSIGNNAFLNCTSLKEITFPAGLDSIGSSAFDSCTSLERIVIPSSVTSVSGSAFSSCVAYIFVETTAIFVSSWTSGWDTGFAGNLYYYSQAEPALNSDSADYDGNYWHYDENNEIVIWTVE